MKASTIEWHLARDDQVRLAKFCDKRKLHSSKYGDNYTVDGKEYFQLLYVFDNDGFIRVELRAGDTRSYTVADHFQVVEYEVGN